jgi:xylulokinase
MGEKQTYLLGVDIGSSNLKCLIVRGDGVVAGSGTKELTTNYPFSGWAEQNPEDWYQALCETVSISLGKAGIESSQIASVCITAATHTPVLLDRNDRVLRPAILWTDQRSTKEVEWLNQNHGQKILEIGYHKANPTWTLPQLFWVRRNEPEVAEKTRKLMIAKDYLRFRITGTWETDQIDALGTLMIDAAKREWSKELCDLIGWSMETLPRICPPTAVVGRITQKAAVDTGLWEGTPVVAGTSDTAAEDYGVGAVNPGQGVIKLATAGNTNVMTEEPHPDPLLFNYYHVIPGMWYTVAATSNCAAVHRWLRDQFFKADIEKSGESDIDAFAVMDQMAATIPAGSDGLIFHPYLLGERTPYWDPFLRGDYLGITMRHRREHFVRALYEGISFSLLDCLRSLAHRGLTMREIRIIGGGSKSPLWRQIVCDVIGLEVLKPQVDDASYGAALIGGVGVGIFKDERDAVRQCVKIASRNQPDMRNHEKYQRLFQIYKESQKRLADINHQLHRFSEA